MPEVDTTGIERPPSHAIVIRLSYGRRVLLRHARLFTNRDRIVKALGDATSPSVRTEKVVS